MKAKMTNKKGQKVTSKAKGSHKHIHQHNFIGRPHPLAHFFGCCLGDEPTPLSSKIQAIRANLQPGAPLESTTIEPGQPFSITPDMIVGDILINFPKSRPLLQELHPLGLLSPVLDSISLEMFFSDLPVNLNEVCEQLTQIINGQAKHD